MFKTRRSIRKFTEQPVTEDEVRQVVEAAAFAPSWKNTQIARLHRCDRQRKRRTSWRTTACWTSPSTSEESTHGAPALVVLTMIKGRSGYERDGSFSTRLLPTGSPLTRALPRRPSACPRMLGLSTVIMGIYDPAEVAKVVEIPEGQEVAALIELGHPGFRTRRRRRVRMSIRCCDLSKVHTLSTVEAILRCFFSRHKVAGAHELPQAGS